MQHLELCGLLKIERKWIFSNLSNIPPIFISTQIRVCCGNTYRSIITIKLLKERILHKFNDELIKTNHGWTCHNFEFAPSNILEQIENYEYFARSVALFTVTRRWYSLNPYVYNVTWTKRIRILNETISFP